MKLSTLIGVLSVMFFALGLASIAHLSLGSEPLSLSDVFLSLWRGPNDHTLPHTVVVWELRLTRLLGALIVGASLAVSGAALQGLFQNPLADPYVLGITSGGACGAAIALWLGSAVFFGPTAGAFLGALVAAGLLLIVARAHAGVNLYSILLAGIAVGLMFSAVLSYVLVMAAPNRHDHRLFWTSMGLELTEIRDGCSWSPVYSPYFGMHAHSTPFYWEKTPPTPWASRSRGSKLRFCYQPRS